MNERNSLGPRNGGLATIRIFATVGKIDQDVVRPYTTVSNKVPMKKLESLTCKTQLPLSTMLKDSSGPSHL
jgi:hypothetical protein